MHTISINEMQARIPSILRNLDEPLIIQTPDRQDIAVMMSPQEFDRLRRNSAASVMDICRQASDEAKKQGMNAQVLEELLRDES